ncbi:hypothetical protein [Yeosuana sp.]|uniref:hypothetical protein n=1 Tax=Yeosuana sp. TaxID=2529388 RepID=UPI004054CA5E
MKSILRVFTLLAFISTFMITSCRTEELVSIQGPPDQVLEANSTVATLIQRMVINDGSNDNIIDNSNCFNVQFPITVFVNGLEITVNSENDFDDIEAVFDEFDDDIDTLQIQFPITIILTDFSEVVINTSSELNAQSSACNGENESDDDIECIDFEYPIKASIFNTNNEVIASVTLNNDKDLYGFIDAIDKNDIINIDFPITVILFDGTEIVINNLDELERTIETYQNDCDEDDDNDFNDDDCNNCSDNQLIGILTGCTDWRIDKLERNDSDLEDIYVGYLFDFLSDGSISVTSGGNLYVGTWNASGTGNNVTVTLNMPTLSDFNNSWNLHEIEQENGESKIDLRLGDDQLRFESDCGNNGGGSIDDTTLVAALATGDWFITFYFNDTDKTTNYNDYVFNFASDGTGIATNTNGSTNGTWSTSSGNETLLELNLNFGTTIPLDELAEDWDVLEATNNIIRLKDVSGGDGSEDFLTFERTQGAGGNDLSNVLADGIWIVASYSNNGSDKTGDYNGYQLNFDIAGTVVATNVTSINGTWVVQSSGNKLVLDFGTLVPFDEFNDDWDVLSVSGTQVFLQDVSGGNGETYVLTLQKL